jgi:hypothetical protein
LLDQTTSEAIALIPIGTVVVALFAISIQLYFHTNSFAQEYSEKVASLVVQANSQISANIQSLLEIGAAKPPKQSKLDSVLPIPAIDLTEQTLSEIRRIGAEADYWQGSLARGKSYLRRSALWLVVCAVVLVAVVFVLVLKTGPEPALIMEYAGGIPVLLFAHDIYQFYAIQKKLDKARIV